MKTTQLFAIAALAAVTSFGAMAGEATAPEQEIAAAQSYVSQRNVGEVRAEARAAAQNAVNADYAGNVQGGEYAGSTVDRDALRQATIEAVRMGQIARGELAG